MISRRTIVRGAFVSAALPVATARAEEMCRPFLQTEEGPFFPAEDIPNDHDLTIAAAGGPRAAGEVMYVFGVVTGPDCAPLSGANVTIWQTDDHGEYKHPAARPVRPLDPNFRYFARQRVGADGFYWFRTIAPEHYDFSGIRRARHIHFEVTHPAHGRITSEMYFAGAEDDARRDIDVVWRQRPAAHRASLIIEQRPAAAYAGSSLPFALDAPFSKFDLSFSQLG